MTIDFNETIKSGVEQAMKECELTIGMTLKECVEKQIPKKQIFKNDSIFCPSCGRCLIHHTDYCGGCGQKLLRESEEE